MKYEEIKNDLENIIKMVKTDISDFDDDLSFSDLGINSLMYIRILVMIEEKYNIQLDEEVVKKGVTSFDTIHNFALYLSEKYS